MRPLKFIQNHYYQIILSLIILIIAGVTLMYFFPWKVATFNSVEVQGEVRAGGTITYQLDLCRYVGKGTRVEPRRFIVPQGKPLQQAIELSSSASLETTGDVGCFKNDPVTIPVDVGTPQGKYQLLIQVQYCIFPGRCIPVEKRSSLFDINQASIPDQLSVITQQLQDLSQYAKNHPEELPVANVAPQATPLRTQPSPQQATPQTTTPQPAPQTTMNPQQTANSLNLNTGILDVTLGLPILNLLGGR